jgi:hypothetical protein
VKAGYKAKKKRAQRGREQSIPFRQGIFAAHVGYDHHITVFQNWEDQKGGNLSRIAPK